MSLLLAVKAMTVPQIMLAFSRCIYPTVRWSNLSARVTTQSSLLTVHWNNTHFPSTRVKGLMAKLNLHIVHGLIQRMGRGAFNQHCTRSRALTTHWKEQNCLLLKHLSWDYEPRARCAISMTRSPHCSNFSSSPWVIEYNSTWHKARGASLPNIWSNLMETQFLIPRREDVEKLECWLLHWYTKSQ